MFGVYSQRMRQQRQYDACAPQTIGHDRMNYMNPTVNYDKPPRKFRPVKPKKTQEPTEIALPDASKITCACMKNIKASSKIVKVIGNRALSRGNSSQSVFKEAFSAFHNPMSNNNVQDPEETRPLTSTINSDSLTLNIYDNSET